MSSKNEIKIIGLTGRGNIPKYVIAGIVSALVVWVSALFPYRSDRYLLFSLPVGIIAFVSTVWQIRKPNLHIKYFLQVSASALLTLLAYRCISYVFSEFSLYIAVLLVSAFIFVHTLPIWNLSLSTLIGDELYAPKTWVGKIVFRGVLALAPFALISGSLGKVATNKSKPPILLFAMTCLYLAFTIPFPSLSRYSKGYQPSVDDGLESEDVRAATKKLLSQRPPASGKRVLRKKKE